MRGGALFARIEAQTAGAMGGSVPIEDVFGSRLEAIRPTREEVDAVGRLYVETVEPTARAAVALLSSRGWSPLILSGGFRRAIRPLADFLGIARVEAVDLLFGPDGSYRGYDTLFPTTRSGGKPEIIRRLRAELSPERIVMVGDGESDLEAMGEADLFIGFGRYVARDRVRLGAHSFATSLAEVPGIVGV
jgi:phosphoserine phosphatase